MILAKLIILAAYLLTPETKHRVEVKIVIPAETWIEPITEGELQAI